MNVDEALASVTRGIEQLYGEDELRERMASGRTLRIKLGMDPTAPDLHLGHSVVLRVMRRYQDLGHRAVLIIGDYTARIGDPSGRDMTRPVLDEQTIDRNAKTYLDQAGRILDVSDEKLEVRRNSEWLGGLTFADVLRLCGQVTVQQMLHRDSFRKRMNEQREIMVSEFMYPLMQAYDSVVIRADVELGGTDQTFNNLLGRELMGRHDLPRQAVSISPLLVGLDGHDKMSKSKGNYVAVTHDPDEMYGRIMSIPDTLMANYFELLTEIEADEIATVCDAERTHPREAKDRLARAVVAEYHDEAAATAASEEFTRRFREHQLPTDLEARTVERSPVGILSLITSVGFASSNSEARRLVQQGAVTLGDVKISDPRAEVEVCDGAVLKVGKRRVCRLEVK